MTKLFDAIEDDTNDCSNPFAEEEKTSGLCRRLREKDEK